MSDNSTAYAAQLEQAARDAALTRSGFWAGGADAMPYAQVATSANLRTGPGTAFAVNRAVPADTPLTIFGRNQDATWFQVRTPARDGGWMAGTVLSLAVAAQAIPVADDIPQAPASSPAAAGDANQPPTDTRTGTGATDTGSGARNADPAPQGDGVLRIIALDKRAEYVIIRNDGGAPVNLRGWTVVSVKGNQTWTVPFDFDLAAGANVTVHALGGTNDDANLYSGFGSNIWNNSESDPAVLLNPAGEEVSRY